MRRVVAAVAAAALVGCGSPDLGRPASEPSPETSTPRDCPRFEDGRGGAIIEWTDFVNLGGVSYLSDHYTFGASIPPDRVGALYGVVRCKLADNVSDTGYRPSDGDASFLEPGTEVYEINGYDPRFRLTARRDGRWLVYEADTVPGADHGRDLLDIEGRVTYIGLNSVKDGSTEVAAITGEKRVEELVDMVLAAPVDQDLDLPDDGHDDQMMVAFHLDDGTASVRALYPESRYLARGITVPAEFVKEMESAPRS